MYNKEFVSSYVKMRRGGEGENMAVPQLTSSSSTRRLSLRTTRPDPFLSLCKCFSFVVVLSAILCIAVNVLSAIRSFKHQSDVRCIPLSISLSLKPNVNVIGFSNSIYCVFCCVLSFRFSMAYFGVTRSS